MKTDSIISAEERSKKWREESEVLEKTLAAQKAQQTEREKRKDKEYRESEAQHAEKALELISDFETREQLLQRIRDMREIPSEPVQHIPPPLSEHSRTQLELEQAAGREAVARHEAERERNLAIRRRIEEETRAHEGFMQPVVHPNPSVDTVFPTSGATIK